MDATSVYKTAQSVFQTVLQTVPAGMDGHKEPLACGGREFWVGHQRRQVGLHVAYGPWFSLSDMEGAFQISYSSGAETVPLESLPDRFTEFLDLVSWLTEALDPAIARFHQMAERRRLLLDELLEAFPDHGLDGGISVSQGLLEDDYRHDDVEAMRQAYASDTTHSWRAVSDQALESGFGPIGLSYLDGKGARYYLPALLRLILRVPDADCEFYTRLFLLPGTGDNARSLDETITFLKLTDPQGAVIAKYLLLLKEEESDWVEQEKQEAPIDAWVRRFHSRRSV